MIEIRIFKFPDRRYQLLCPMGDEKKSTTKIYMSKKINIDELVAELRQFDILGFIGEVKIEKRE
jgi:hypothetical protein